MSYVTPWTGDLEEEIYEIEIPSNLLVGSDTYNFQQWEDGSTNPVRTVNLFSDMVVTASYQLVIPPPSKGYLEVHAFSDSVEVIADGLIGEKALNFQTPTIPPLEVDPGIYTVKLVYRKVNMFYTATVTVGQTIRVDGHFAVAPPPPISLLRWLAPLGAAIIAFKKVR